MIFGNTFVVLTKLASCHQTTLSFPSRHVPVLRCDRYLSRWDPLTAAITLSPWWVPPVIGVWNNAYNSNLCCADFIEETWQYICISLHSLTLKHHKLLKFILAVFFLYGIPQFNFHCHLTQCSESIAIFYCFYFVLSAYKGRYFQIFPTLSSLYWQMSSLAGNWSQGYFLLIKYST